MTGRARVVGAVGLLVGLIVLQVGMGPLFVLPVAVALIVAPAINWAAVRHLAAARRARAARGEAPIRSLRAAYFASTFLAVASSAIALVAAITILRAIPSLGIPSIPREVYLLGLAYPLILLTGPAVEWLALFRGDAGPVDSPQLEEAP